jgi:hypothetical protein
MTNYQWTTTSALFQLRWEPSERRASAVDYLTSVVLYGDDNQAREIAAGLLALYGDTAPDGDSPENRDIRDASLTCSVCDGPLEVSAQEPQAGYLHANDADDTHVPEYRAENTSDPNHRLYVRPENRIA